MPDKKKLSNAEWSSRMEMLDELRNEIPSAELDKKRKELLSNVPDDDRPARTLPKVKPRRKKKQAKFELAEPPSKITGRN